MPVVRISKGRFDPANAAEAERLLAESERALRGPLTQLPGLLHYYVGIDRVNGQLTNVSPATEGGAAAPWHHTGRPVPRASACSSSISVVHSGV